MLETTSCQPGSTQPGSQALSSMRRYGGKILGARLGPTMHHGTVDLLVIYFMVYCYLQTAEGQFFSNKSHSKAMHDFLQILGEEVELFGFKG